MQNRRVLLVDDNSTNLLVAKSLLGKLEVEPVVVMNGLEAVAAAKVDQYDLILMDCMMPVMDGYEATQNIRSDKGSLNHETPIVAVTANSLPEDRVRCDIVGMNGVVTKPLSFEKLRQVLKKWIEPTANTNESEFDEFEGNMPQIVGEIFNSEYLVKNFGDSVEFLEQITESFELTISEQLDAIEETIFEKESPVELREGVHRLRGASGNCGAERLEFVASEIEAACQSREADRAVSLYPKLKQEAEQLRSVLRSINWDSEISKHYECESRDLTDS